MRTQYGKECTGGGGLFCDADENYMAAEFYFGTALPASDACTGALGHGTDGTDYCYGDTADPILDDGMGFSTGRDGGMDFGWDCDGDTNVDFSAGRRAPPRETYGLNHFDRYGECVGSPTNWQLAVPPGAYEVDVDFAADSRGWDGAQCSDLHVGEDAVAFLTVEGNVACSFRPGCMYSDVVIVADGKLTITGYSHTVGGGTCHSIAFVKIKTYLPPQQTELAAEFCKIGMLSRFVALSLTLKASLLSQTSVRRCRPATPAPVPVGTARNRRTPTASAMSPPPFLTTAWASPLAVTAAWTTAGIATAT